MREMQGVVASFQWLFLLWIIDIASVTPLSTKPAAGGPLWAPQQHPELFSYLSVLIPAYNEEDRLGRTLESYQKYLISHPYWNPKHGRCQIVVADDGSKDTTAKLVHNFALEAKVPVSCVSLSRNAGKGAALGYGMAHILAQKPNSWILTADADASAPLSALDPMIRQVEAWYSSSTTGPKNSPRNYNPPLLQLLATGYRTYASTSPSRLVFRWGFRTVVRTIAGDLGVRDTQCGIKLLSPAAAAMLYRDLHLKGWSHDVEVLYRARALGMVVLEEPVAWQDQDGSKLVASPGGVLAVSAQMLAQVIQLRWGYEKGAWKLPETRVIRKNEQRHVNI